MEFAQDTQVLETQFLGEVELSYKTNVPPSERKKVTCSEDIYHYLKEIWSNKLEHVEEFMILCLNRANHVLGWAKISCGGIAGTVADPKVIFQVALKTNASSLILAHNHPSGQLKPSSADILLTNKMKEAGKFLDIPVLDHIIVTSEYYYSFADMGEL